MTAAELIDRIDNAAARPDDPPPVRLKKTLLIFLSVFAVLASACAFPVFGLAAAAYGLLSAAGLFYLLAAKREAAVAWLQPLALLAAPLSLHWVGGGRDATGAVVLWALLSPLSALVLLGDGPATAFFGGFLTLVFGAGFLDVLSAGGEASALRATRLFVVNAAVLSAIVFITLRYFVREREKAYRALALEQEKSERLLLNILPAPIAERLKATGKTSAEGFAEASVLFADIVGFTPLSATLTPEKLVEVLNELFSDFDRLAERHGVEKIKTIGDAYMVCAGLPVPAADHAERIAEMALGMRDAVQEFNRRRGLSLQVRIGVNSGPVVAGVIGLKKFIYDLWGDTVNTASRMESHGKPGAVHAAEGTYLRLKGRYAFEDRGEIEVKGLGRRRTWFLLGRAA